MPTHHSTGLPVICNNVHHDDFFAHDVRVCARRRRPSVEVLRKSAHATWAAAKLFDADDGTDGNLWMHLPGLEQCVQRHHFRVGGGAWRQLRHSCRYQLPAGQEDASSARLHASELVRVACQLDRGRVCHCHDSAVLIPSGIACYGQQYE